METALVELVRSADHFAGVVLVSWHGGNAEAVAEAVARSRADGRDVSRWEPRLPGGGDVHAGRIETSLMLADRARAGRARSGPRARPRRWPR